MKNLETKMTEKKKAVLKLCEQEKLGKIKSEKDPPRYMCLKCGRMASKAESLTQPKSLDDY